ncbi:MAG: hypothetical protein HQL72_02350 [Magnetococcales bacterium]|nr:hypothetical protein [Magnetococcales bacterium]
MEKYTTIAEVLKEIVSMDDKYLLLWTICAVVSIPIIFLQLHKIIRAIKWDGREEGET